MLLFLILKKNVKDCILPTAIHLLRESCIVFPPYCLRAQSNRNSPCYQAFPTECHLQLCITSQVIATVSFPYSKVTPPAHQCILLCLTWIWVPCSERKMITLHTPPHQFSSSIGKLRNISQAEIFNFTWIGQSMRFSSPLLCTDAFQAVLFCEARAVAKNSFSPEAVNAHQENSTTEGTVEMKVRRLLRDFQEFIYVQKCSHKCYMLSAYIPKTLQHNSHLSSGQSTATNPCARSRFYRSAEAEQKEMVQVTC